LQQEMLKLLDSSINRIKWILYLKQNILKKN
jgi:hypothetical protein